MALAFADTAEHLRDAPFRVTDGGVSFNLVGALHRSADAVDVEEEFSNLIQLARS